MCNAACQAKILLNGARVVAEAEAAVNLVKLHQAGIIQISDADGERLQEIFDPAEDLLTQWNNKQLKKTGYVRKTLVAKL